MVKFVQYSTKIRVLKNDKVRILDFTRSEKFSKLSTHSTNTAKIILLCFVFYKSKKQRRTVRN